MGTKNITKVIKVVKTYRRDREEDKSIEVLHRLHDKSFRSYKAIALELEIDEKVVVSVYESLGACSIFVGYGEVERTKKGWIEPRRLQMDY